jgi:perosamine synthetase
MTSTARTNEEPMAIQYPVSKPWLEGRELEYVTETVTDGWISSQGPFVKRFEKAFADYNGTTHGVACSSGTTALTLALRALGVGPGDEVIVPEFTMIASAWAVTYTGATPVFVDCGEDLNIDVSLIEAKITPRTKVIMPVHIYGRRCDMDAIMTLAYEYNLRVVEDSAEAHGVLPVADIACFSLFGNKIITSGEGGICVTNDGHLADQMAHLRAMAFDKDHTFLHKKVGYNFRMTAMQAAVALAQTEQLDEILSLRTGIEKRYDDGLAGISGITLMPPRNVLWMYDLRAERRDELRAFLAGAGIETRLFFKPMSRQPGYLDPDWPSLNASRFSEDGFYLPTHTGLTEADQDYICGKIREFHSS